MSRVALWICAGILLGVMVFTKFVIAPYIVTTWGWFGTIAFVLMMVGIGWCLDRPAK